MKTALPLRRWIGLLLAVIGIILFLRLTGYLDGLNIPSYVFSWPMILVVLGVFFLATRENRSTGFFLLLVGGAFLARDILELPFREIIVYLIPALLVFTGLKLLFSRGHAGRVGTAEEYGTHAGNDINAVHIFSGGKRIIESQQFLGGEVVCIFGGADIHFRNTTLQHEKTVLHVFCLFGGCNVYVPDDWIVRTETTTIFGEASDKRNKISGSGDEAGKQILTISGTLLFGGVDIKSE